MWFKFEMGTGGKDKKNGLFIKLSPNTAQAKIFRSTKAGSGYNSVAIHYDIETSSQYGFSRPIYDWKCWV